MRTVHLDAAASEAILQAMPGIVLMVDAQARIEYANPGFAELVDRPVETLIGTNWITAFVPDAERPPLRELAARAARPPGRPLVARSSLTVAGDVRYVEWQVRACPPSASEVPRTLWIGRDITDEGRAALARRRAESLLASVGDNMFDAQLLLSVEGDGTYRIRAANRRYLEVLRLHGIDVTEASLVGKTREELVFDLGVQPESRDHARGRYLEAIRTRQAVRYETSFVLAGRRLHVETSIAPIFDERGICTYLVRTTRDLTARVEADRALRVSEARLLEAQTLARIGSWELRLPAMSMVWSAEIFRLLELPESPDMVSHERFIDRVHPDDRDTVRQVYRASVADRAAYHVVHRLQMPDGRVKWMDGRCETEYAADGSPLRSVGTLQDITERIVAEQALGETRTAYRRLDAVSRVKDRAIEASINGIVFTDLDGVIGYVNRSFLRLWGFDSDHEVIGRPAWQLYVEQARAEAAMQSLRLGQDWIGELEACRVDGSTFTILLSATVIRDDAGEPVQLMASIVDVTARSRAEAGARRSHDLLRMVIDSSPDGIFLKDADHRFLLVNNAFAAIAGVSPEQMIGRPDSDFWDRSAIDGDPDLPSRGFRLDDRRALAGDVVTNDHVPLRHADGEWRIFSTVKRPMIDDGGRVYGVLGYTRDVTEQHANDERRRRSLEEKEILLREIHHRVKNNLQIVSSLLHFQAKNVRAPEDRAAFEDGRKRLLAMILVHDRLYQSADLTSVEFGLYARSLVAALVATFEDNGRVRIAMETDDLRLPAELALPSGLILCELVTNVFKYAYPDGRSGTAHVSVTGAAGRVAIEVRDTGVGFPGDFDPRAARTFGWHLIATLVQQLAATIETASAGGARVRIAYDVPEKTESQWSHTRTLRP